MMETDEKTPSPESYLSPESIAIFLFHGVIEHNDSEVRNYNRKHIEVDKFRTVLKELKQHGTAYSMDALMRDRQAGSQPPRNSFIITFDDGFENNYSVAAPILEEFNLNAIFYVSSKFIDENAMSWIDRIELAVELSESGTLSFPQYQFESSFTHSRESKIATLEAIRGLVKFDSSIEPDKFTNTVFEQLNLTPINAASGPLDQKMSWEQVRALNEHPLFTVGGHGHRHVILSFLNKSELEQEIHTSMEMLSEKASVRTPHYSYPEGLKHCYSPEVISELKKHKIQCSPSAELGVNTGQESLFDLKRIPVV